MENPREHFWFCSIDCRFWSKVEVDEITRCWNWKASLCTSGYGQFHAPRQRIRPYPASTFIFRHLFGVTQEKPWVLHRCDNRKCVNPDHLFTGSLHDNMADMVSKGRQAHGQRCGHAKLTIQQVREIRAAIGKQKDIADVYQVTFSTVSAIRARKTWRFV